MTPKEYLDHISPLSSPDPVLPPQAKPAAHTPGPWVVHDGGRFGQFGDLGPSICADKGNGRCQPLFEICGPGNPDECEANARLVAAAPELLKALKYMVWTFEKLGNGKAITQARAVIAKTEGRE